MRVLNLPACCWGSAWSVVTEVGGERGGDEEGEGEQGAYVRGSLLCGF
jgi:hypothetical protein